MGSMAVDDKDLGAIHSLTQLVVRGQADKGDWRGALEIYKSVLETKICVCGHDHPDVAASFYNIGVVYRQKGDLENALVQHQKALEIRTRVFGSEHPDVATSYQNLAAVYHRQGNHVQTKEMATKAYHIFLKVLGPDHPYTQMSSKLSRI